MSKQTAAEMAAEIRRLSAKTDSIERLQIPGAHIQDCEEFYVYTQRTALDIAEALEGSVLTLAAGDMHVAVRISDKDLAIEMGRLIAENERLKLECECLTAGKCMAVARLAGIVEGRPTETINYLQRIDELREKEVRLEKAEALLRRVESRLPVRRGIATYFADQRI